MVTDALTVKGLHLDRDAECVLMILRSLNHFSKHSLSIQHKKLRVRTSEKDYCGHAPTETKTEVRVRDEVASGIWADVQVFGVVEDGLVEVLLALL